MKNVLITGGTGLVGSTIKTISKDYKTKYNFIYVERKHCDLLNYNSTLAYFIETKPDYVIHLAANVGGLFRATRILHAGAPKYNIVVYTKLSKYSQIIHKYMNHLFMYNYSQSHSTISLTNSSKLHFGIQPSSLRAFVLSPNNSSTSAGLKYFSDININSLPVFVS